MLFVFLSIMKLFVDVQKDLPVMDFKVVVFNRVIVKPIKIVDLAKYASLIVVLLVVVPIIIVHSKKLATIENVLIHVHWNKFVA